MSKGGRPMIMDAIRYACGKINQKEMAKAREVEAKRRPDATAGEPSPKVRANRDLFNAKCFKGGGLGNHAGDAIGQLWLLGRIDVDGYDDVILLNAVRAWWHGRGVTFKALDYKTASHERASRSSSSSDKLSKPERDFRHYSSFLLDADDYEQDCLESLMETELDGEFPGWVSRLIQTELLKHIRLPIVALATDDDEDKLLAAKRAMLAMAGVEARPQKSAA